LGDNATGKPTILRCLSLASLGLAAANEVLDGDARDLLRQGTDWGAIEVQFRLLPFLGCKEKDSKSFVVGLRIDKALNRFSPLKNVDLTGIAGVAQLNCIEGLGRLRNEQALAFGFICAYGPNRTLTDSRVAIEPEYATAEREWVVSMFRPDAPLTRPESLRRFMRGDTRNIKMGPESLAPNIVEAIRSGIAQLLPNTQLSPPDAKADLGIHGIEVRLDQLSEGYRSILAFVGHVLRCALRHLKWRGDPFAVHGIVLIDELDAHLHPIWQTHIFDDLQRAFPNIQFIASTHSPLLVASLKSANVFTLLRDDPAGVRIANPSIDPQGMGFEGILKSEMFGLRSTVDFETQRRLDERNQLYGKGENRTKEEDERLSQLSESLSHMGFAMDFKDPYLSQFVASMARRARFTRPVLTPEEIQEQSRLSDEIIDEILATETQQ